MLDIEATPVASGEIVTGDDANAIVDLAYTLIGCLNANDIMRSTTLLSDDLIARAAYDIVGSLEDLAEGTPEPLEETDQAAITKMSGVTRLDDGRLALSIGLGYVYPDDPREFVTEFYIQILAAEQRGEWKIDDLRPYIEPDEPADCGSAGADGCIQVTGTVVSGNGYSGYIMPPELASGTADYFLNTGSTDVLAFTPTEAMVAEAEAALPVYVAASPRATERIINELATYQRQYLGFTTADGSVLVINAFCDSSYDPAGNVVVVMDGGDCFWQAVYDLTTHAFTYFSVNGNA